MELPQTLPTRSLQYLMDQIISSPVEIVEDYSDDSSNTVVCADNEELDQQYWNTLNALQYYVDPILIEEIGGQPLPIPGAEEGSWCLVPGYPDPMQLFYYNIILEFLSTLMQAAKGERSLSSAYYSDATIDRAYAALQRLNPSDNVVQLYNDCLNTLLSCLQYPQIV